MVRDWKLSPKDEEQDNGAHFHHCYQQCAKSSNQNNQIRKRNRRHPIWKKISKTISFADDMSYTKSQRIHKGRESDYERERERDAYIELIQKTAGGVGGISPGHIACFTMN